MSKFLQKMNIDYKHITLPLNQRINLRLKCVGDVARSILILNNCKYKDTYLTAEGFTRLSRTKQMKQQMEMKVLYKRPHAQAFESHAFAGKTPALLGNKALVDVKANLFGEAKKRKKMPKVAPTSEL